MLFRSVLELHEEADLLQWKKVRFLAGRAGERFRGRITGVQPFGLFVQLEDYHVDGLVPIRTLADDYYLYEPEAHRLVGERRGRVFQLADPVEVELTGADLRHRGLDLKILGMPEAPPRAAGRAAGKAGSGSRGVRGRLGRAGGAGSSDGSGSSGGSGGSGGTGSASRAGASGRRRRP